MTPMHPPIRVGRFEPILLADTVIRWGPVSVLTARPSRTRIIVEHAHGYTPDAFRRTEPRC
jgi:hypothetical protein